MRIVFLCTHNAGRSQMAAAWTKYLGGEEVQVFSGGSEPASEINANAVAAMAEVGIDISGKKPARFTDELVRSADRVVTMGCGDECPYFPGVIYEDWDIGDPAGQDLSFVRNVRDEIEARVRVLVSDSS